MSYSRHRAIGIRETSRQFSAIVPPQDPISKASLLWTLTRCNFIDARMTTDRLIRSAPGVSLPLSLSRGWILRLPNEITTITASGSLRWICLASIQNRHPGNLSNDLYSEPLVVPPAARWTVQWILNSPPAFNLSQANLDPKRNPAGDRVRPQRRDQA